MYVMFPDHYHMKEVPEDDEQFDSWVQAQVDAFEELISQRFHRQIEIKIAEKDDNSQRVFHNLGYIDELTAESLLQYSDDKPYVAMPGINDRYVSEFDSEQVIYDLNPSQYKSGVPWNDMDLLSNNPLKKRIRAERDV